MMTNWNNPTLNMYVKIFFSIINLNSIKNETPSLWFNINETKGLDIIKRYFKSSKSSKYHVTKFITVDK